MPIYPSNPSLWPRWLGLPHQRRGRRRRFGTTNQSAPSTTPMPSNYYVGLVIIAVVTLACFNMALGMSEGLPTNPHLAERMHYLTTHTAFWQYGWLTWMAAALGLLVFCHLLTRYMPVSTLSRIGLSLVSIGIAPDISAEVIYAWVLPGVQDVETFLLLDRIAMLLTGLVGNGAYCLGGLCLNLALYANPALSRAMLGFGLPSWLIGMLISVSTAMHHLPAAAMFTAIAMVWNVLWMFWFCQAVLRHAPRENTGA